MTDHPGDDWLPRWSPDGKKIAFLSQRAGNLEIYVMNADGSNPVNVSRGHEIDYYPQWSPDGTQLLFLKWLGDGYDLYRVNADGSSRTRLTQTLMAREPAWSPDGTKIVFSSSPAGNSDLYLMNSDGSGVLQLTNTADASEQEPAWSPDGTEIAYLRLDEASGRAVYLMNAGGGNQRQLSTSPPLDGPPIWSPDGQKLLFISQRDGNAEVYSMNSDGSGQTNLTNHVADEYDPVWQPLITTPPATSTVELSLGEMTTTVTEGDNDEILEPGESGQLSVQLLNKGTAAASGVSATLTSSTPGVTVTSSASSYSDAQPSGYAINATPFRFSVDPTMPCGQPLDFTLTVTRAGGQQPETFDIKVPTGQPGDVAVAASYQGAPVEIPDDNHAGVNIPVEVSNFLGTVSDLRFHVGGSSCTTDAGASTVGISHSYASDLVLKLTSPNGTTVKLFDAAGGRGGNFCNMTLADDAAGGSVQDLFTENAPYTGAFRPAEPLTAFRGENPNGTWTLNVSDRVEGEVGVVRDFALVLNAYTCERAVGDPDLSLTMKAGPDPAEVNSDLFYTITVGNGQDIATGVRVTDTLPPNVEFVSASSSHGSCSRAGSSVACDVGTLRAHGLAVVTIRVRPTEVGTITNAASVTSNEADANQSNNIASQSVTAKRTADLVVTNVDSPDPIPVGGSTTYTIKVKNAGPSPASGVTVTLRSDPGGVQTFNVGNLAVNASHTVTTTASGSTFGTLANTATVTANETDPRPENNTAAQSTRVVTLQKLHYNFSSLPGCPDSAAGRGEGRVYLTSAAPVGGAVVTLTSSNPKITIPGSVTVEAGGSFAVFDINVNGLVSAQVEGEITASYAGTSKARAITARPISLKWIFRDSWSGFGGDAAHYTADLECGQSPNDIAVTLSSADPGVAYISTPQDGVLMFSPGTTRRFFTVRTNPVATSTTVLITATANGHSVNSSLLVKPR